LRNTLGVVRKKAELRCVKKASEREGESGGGREVKKKAVHLPYLAYLIPRFTTD
jgi:hypothetical protein